MDIIRYAVKIPSSDSFVTEIGYTFPRANSKKGVFISEHKIFDALADDCKLFILTGRRGWGEQITPCDITVGDLRKLRREFVKSVKPYT